MIQALFKVVETQHVKNEKMMIHLYVLIGGGYRVATHFKLCLTVTGLIMQTFKTRLICVVKTNRNEYQIYLILIITEPY